MAKFSFDKLFNDTSVCALELHIGARGELLFNWIILSRKRGHVVKEEWGTEQVSSVEELKSIVGTELPVSLSVSGKGVLHKRVIQQGASKERLFDYVFPNARISDYLMQTLLCDDNSFHVSVVRKDQASRLLDEFNKAGLLVVELSLGPLGLVSFYKTLEVDISELNTGKHIMKCNRFSLVDYSYHQVDQAIDQTINIDGEPVLSNLLVAYANAFQYLAKVSNAAALDFETLEDNKEVYKSRRLYHMLLWGGLFAFLIILLFNAIGYVVVSSQYDEISSEYNSKRQISLSSQHDVIEFGKKEDFLVKSGWLNPAALSYYADRIAASVPDQVQLTSLEASPLNEYQSKKMKKEVFDHNLLVIQGIVSNPIELNSWTKKVSGFSWVSNVKVENYTFDHKASKGVFTLLVSLSGELE